MIRFHKIRNTLLLILLFVLLINSYKIINLQNEVYGDRYYIDKNEVRVMQFENPVNISAYAYNFFESTMFIVGRNVSNNFPVSLKIEFSNGFDELLKHDTNTYKDIDRPFFHVYSNDGNTFWSISNHFNNNISQFNLLHIYNDVIIQNTTIIEPFTTEINSGHTKFQRNLLKVNDNLFIYHLRIVYFDEGNSISDIEDYFVYYNMKTNEIKRKKLPYHPTWTNTVYYSQSFDLIFYPFNPSIIKSNQIKSYHSFIAYKLPPVSNLIPRNPELTIHRFQTRNSWPFDVYDFQIINEEFVIVPFGKSFQNIVGFEIYKIQNYGVLTDVFHSPRNIWLTRIAFLVIVIRPVYRKTREMLKLDE